MFPGIDGFHWSVGHVLFLSLFFMVALTILTTVASAVWRTARDFRTHRATEFCWRSDFAELAEKDRRCRHELAGRVTSRTCDHGFDCRQCENYSQFAVLPERAVMRDPGVGNSGIGYSNDRLYHRGHTWVKREEDGMLSVGLDELAERVMGSPDAVEMPEMGSEIEVNGSAWRMKKNGKEVRVRAPIDGTVVGIGGPKEGWYLKVRPRRDANDPATLRHLLRGAEVHGWLARELERLQLQLRPSNTVPSLADGGTLMQGLMDAVPDADWSTVLADTFLET